MSNLYFFKAVNYEWNMLQFSYSKLSEDLSKEDKNCYLECFLIHAKVLLEFLMEKGSDGRKSGEFLDKKISGWRKERGKILSEKKRIKLFIKFNSLLSHLGKERVSLIQKDKCWNLSSIFKTITSLLKEYDEYLDSSNKPHDWLKDMSISKKFSLVLQSTSDIGTTSIIQDIKI